MGIYPSDRFCRSAVYPLFVRSDIFDAAALLSFSPIEGSRARAVSLAGWDKCADEMDVHDFGIKLEAVKNRRAEQKRQRNLVEEEIHHYLGFYSFLARKLDQSALIYTTFKLFHDDSDGDDRHYQYEIHPNGETVSDKQIKSDERIARSQIGDILFGPTLLPEDSCCERKIYLQKASMKNLPDLLEAVG